MKKAFHVLSFIMALVSTAVFTVCGIYYTNFPENYSLNSSSYPFSINSVVSLHYTNESVQTYANTESDNQSQNAQLMLFDTIPIKDVTVTVNERKYVTLCGIPFGIKMYTKGVLVVKTEDIETPDGVINPSSQADIRSGDVILSINGEEISSNDDIQDIIENSGGNTLTVELQRDDVSLTTELIPVISLDSQEYRAGIWVRDSIAGIGTLTYYDAETGIFGGLGHGICDVDTDVLMPFQSGEILKASISSIRKSTGGVPGSLCGSFTGSGAIGTILCNTESGIYGTMEESPADDTLTPVANRYEIQTGSAQILTTIDGEIPQYYDIEIEFIDYSESGETKNMVICITDERLIEETGGIVQGMSGSPIVQNGKFVGAVTHVFVNDTLRGYAIFAENMLSNNDSIIQSNTELAA